MSSQDPSRHHVLVIDDDATMRDLLSLLLGMEGHSVLLADSGQAALDLAATLSPAERQAEHPTVLLTDLQMPGLTGTRLATRLRAAFPQAKLIAMSGTRPVAAKLAAYDAFLQKPFTAADFAAAVSSPGASSSSRSKTKPSAAPAASKSTSQPDLDEAVYTKLTASMPPTQLKQLYAMCLDDSLTRITRMTLSAESGDGPAFTREAHAIKGGCGMLGARELHELASRMETGALLCTSLLSDFPVAVERLRRILDART